MTITKRSDSVEAEFWDDLATFARKARKNLEKQKDGS